MLAYAKLRASKGEVVENEDALHLVGMDGDNESVAFGA